MITKSENAKKQIKKWTQRRLENLEEYGRYSKMYKIRLESLIERNSAYKIKEILEDIEEEIDRAELMIRIYKRDLEVIMIDIDFIMDEDLEKIQALTGLNPETVIADFRLFCLYAEIPISFESWENYMIETLDQT